MEKIKFESIVPAEEKTKVDLGELKEKLREWLLDGENSEETVSRRERLEARKNFLLEKYPARKYKTFFLLLTTGETPGESALYEDFPAPDSVAEFINNL